MKYAWTVLMLIFSCAVAQAQPYAGGVYPVKVLINGNPNLTQTPTWIPWNGKIEPTITPTYTPTWNATTTQTQPPTPTATATNTPELVRSDVRYIRQSDNPTPSSNLLIPAAFPTPIVFAATTPGYHHKIEVCAQNVGSAPGVLTAGGMTYNFAPYTPRTLYLFSAANGPITLDTTYVAGVTIRCNILHAIVKDGF